LAERRFTSTAAVKNKQTGAQVSHVVQRKKVRPLRISRRNPDAGVHLQKNVAKTRRFEAQKSIVGGKFKGFGSSDLR